MWTERVNGWICVCPADNVMVTPGSCLIGARFHCGLRACVWFPRLILFGLGPRHCCVSVCPVLSFVPCSCLVVTLVVWGARVWCWRSVWVCDASLVVWSCLTGAHAHCGLVLGAHACSMLVSGAPCLMWGTSVWFLIFVNLKVFFNFLNYFFPLLDVK